MIATLVIVRAVQSIALCAGGLFMASDFLHGAGFRFLTAKALYPQWFPSLMGPYQLTFALLNFAEGGKHAVVAQAMLSLLMGGAVHHHFVGEGSAGMAIAPLLFWCSTVAVPILQEQKGFTQTLVLAAALGGLGFAMGGLLRVLGRAEKASKD